MPVTTQKLLKYNKLIELLFREPAPFMPSQQGKEESLMWMIETHLGTASRTDTVPDIVSLTGVCSATTSFVLCVSPAHTQTRRWQVGMVMQPPFVCSFRLISVALEGHLEGFYVQGCQFNNIIEVQEAHSGLQPNRLSRWITLTQVSWSGRPFEA